MVREKGCKGGSNAQHDSKNAWSNSLAQVALFFLIRPSPLCGHESKCRSEMNQKSEVKCSMRKGGKGSKAKHDSSDISSRI